MMHRLLPNEATYPVWRGAGIRTLQRLLQTEATSAALMDRAGLATAQLALAIAPHARRICIVAGPGVNAGHGLQAAIYLQQWGMDVRVHLLAAPAHLPSDTRCAFDRATRAGIAVQCGWPDALPELHAQDLCIDALLGACETWDHQEQGPGPTLCASDAQPRTGQSSPCTGPDAPYASMAHLSRTIAQINAGLAPVLSIDAPCGLDADSGQALAGIGSVVHADHTLTLLGAKPGLFMGHGRDVCGTIWLAPLGALAPHANGPAPDAMLNPAPAPTLRPHASHKGSHGDVVVVGGVSVDKRGMGMSGAAVLAAQAALHGGAGRVMLCLLGPATPALSLPFDLMRCELSALDWAHLTVVAGCGGGLAIAEPLGQILQHSARLVLDADGLNSVARDAWLARLLVARAARQRPTVLTPHPLEAARLLGISTDEVQADRLKAAHQLAQQFGCCVVLKGSGTVIAAPGHTPHINTTGNGLLATGGTGDVLAGLIGARLAASGQAWFAACQAVWTHGHRADGWPSGWALTASRLAQCADPTDHARVENSPPFAQDVAPVLHAVRSWPHPWVDIPKRRR